MYNSAIRRYTLITPRSSALIDDASPKSTRSPTTVQLQRNALLLMLRNQRLVTYVSVAGNSEP